MRIQLIITIISIVSISVYGQKSKLDSTTITEYKREKPESFMLWQVKGLGDFISRFNYQTFINGKSWTDSTKQIYPRGLYVRSLFDEYDVRLGGLNKNQAYINQVDQFIKYVVEEHVTIGEFPELKAKIVAIAESGVGKFPVEIELETIYNKSKKYSSWQISEIHLPKTIALGSEHSNELSECHQGSRYLNPNAHDTSFIQLLDIVNNGQSIIPLVSSKIRLTQEIWTLETSINKGLKLTSIGDVRITLQVDKYYSLELKDFLREKENSGLLISNLVKHP
ncbi:hypothetical protein ACWA1C_20295 [Flectobacillus roseus]|jgi:hypothetical protein